MQKILVVTPRFPFDLRGACEQDRAYGILLLTQLGYDVTVISMINKSHLNMVANAEKEFGVRIIPVLYKKERDIRSSYTITELLKRIFIPIYWDGAAYEYKDQEIQHILAEEIKLNTPKLIWFDYTYLWPLYHIPKSHNIPIITRSLNYEPAHFFNKSPKTFINWLKYLAKKLSERKVCTESNLIFSISPKEKYIYESISKKPIVYIPLRRLGVLIGQNSIINTNKKINVFFIGSNYLVPHMLEALLFILEKVNPLLQIEYPDIFTIHIIGGKLPQHIAQKKYQNIIFHGYIPDLNDFLKTMDIALSPALYGEGMHQKVFEPIVRGIPTITTNRGLGGNPLYDGVHVLTVDDTPESIVQALGKLISLKERQRLSKNAINISEAIFSEQLLKNIIDWNIKKLIS